MKALVLAGGKGTRMRPVSDAMPKHLIPVANKPVIDYVIEDISSCGIDEIGIVVEEEKGEIQQHLGNGDDRDLEIQYIVNEDPKGGLAYAVNCGREFINGDPFLVYFGDTLLSPHITSKIVSNFQRGKHVASIALQSTEEPSRYGIADFNKRDEIIGMHEKPNHPPSDLAYVGAVVFSSAVFGEIKKQEPSGRGELEITDSIDRLIKRGDPVNIEEVEGIWKDIGKPKDVVKANKRLLKEELLGVEPQREDVSIAESAEIKDPCIIGDNVIIGPEATIGPYTTLGDGCEVSHAQIESSVLMKNVKITADIEMEKSLVGPDTEIAKKTEESGRYILGRKTSLHI